MRRMLAAGVPVGGGTDATRVASYNPWVALSWLVTGKTVGGLTVTPAENRLDRETALRIWTEGNTWFSSEVGKKGQIKAGQLADLAVLSEDYFALPEAHIAGLTSSLTLVGGIVVHGSDDFDHLGPPLPQPMPDWSPVRHQGGYQHHGALARVATLAVATCGCGSTCGVHGHDHARAWGSLVPATRNLFWGALGCSCFA